MVIVMQQGCPKAHVEHVCQLIREMKLKDHVIVGTERTVVAVIGDDRYKDRSVLEMAAGGRGAGATGLRGGAFKPRTSPYQFQGLGEKGLEILAEAREQT